MLLAIDRGNSFTKIALFDGDNLRAAWRRNSAGDYAELLTSLFTESAIDRALVDAVVIGSVVPASTAALAQAAKELFGVDAYVATSANAVGIAVDYDPPGTLGIDRLADAVAAVHFVGTPSIAVDMGTATTFNVVVDGPRFIGGAIAPGVGVLSEALSKRTAQLPAVELVKPPRVIARNTQQALQSGLFYGYASMVDGMVARLRAEIGVDCPVIVTGGGASTELIAVCSGVTAVEPHLTLHGLRLLFERRASG